MDTKLDLKKEEEKSQLLLCHFPLHYNEIHNQILSEFLIQSFTHGFTNYVFSNPQFSGLSKILKFIVPFLPSCCLCKLLYYTT